jgi:uncharacterized membrane protein
VATNERGGLRTSLTVPGVLLGVGLGGFIDGILLHQILQWHHMATSAGESASTVGGLETNTLLDGFFHLATWFFVIGGSTLAVSEWRQGKLAPAWRAQVGSLLFGWGVFNLVEGMVDHQILGIHHVRDDLGAPVGWDIGFLVLGLVLATSGSLLTRGGPEATFESRRSP